MVLPEPFGPIRPTLSPFEISKLILLRAMTLYEPEFEEILPPMILVNKFFIAYLIYY